MTTKRVTLPLYGLGCGGSGALTVERALLHVPGVAMAYANPATETAYVQYDPEVCSPIDFVAAVKAVGFRVGEPSIR
jgi:Cu+-exporting ATPase